MVRNLRKPLIIMTPKSLLRHPLSVSKLEDLASGGFRSMIDDIDDPKPSVVTRAVFCSGKVYFDLLKARREGKADNVAIMRLEQLYPFPSDEYEAILRKYSNAREVVWCQEEPQNQGAWYQIRHRLNRSCSRNTSYSMRAVPVLPRRPPASPACTNNSRRISSLQPCTASLLKRLPGTRCAFRPQTLGLVHDN
jgi:2-oxoglutarate dehydrogenase complex dehydrogenase (E1) component-like enzyme